MTTKFKANKPRFDNVRANDGVWFAPYDEVADIEYPMFKLALFDTSSDRYLETIERNMDRKSAKNGFRQPKKLSKREKADAELAEAAKNFIDYSMVDWTVEDDKGKAVAYKHNLAVEYFDTTEQDKRWLIGQCMSFAANVGNYQPDDQEDAPEGN